MTNETQPSQEFLEKQLLLMQEEWSNIFRDWCGNQKDTVYIENNGGCGTLTKIHTGAGYVTLSSLSNSYEMRIYLKMDLPKENNLVTELEEQVLK